jgi:hypothetical protein
MEDLDDMMMAEAIRLSLVAEEERKKKEDKEARKEAKKKEKQEKKAQKAARKGSYQSSRNNSSSTLAGENAQVSSTSNDGKGKGIERAEAVSAGSKNGSSGESSSSVLGLPHLPPSEPLSWTYHSGDETHTRGGSHLRKVSNVSSSDSSIMDSLPSAMEHPVGRLDVSKSAQESSSRAADSSSDGEPLFNFRSLASMIGEEEKTGDSSHSQHSNHRRGENSSPVQEESIGPHDQFILKPSQEHAHSTPTPEPQS